MQRAAQMPRLSVQFLDNILDLTKNRPGMLLKNQASWSQQNMFASTLKQGDAQARLQVTDLLRDAWLGYSQPVRRSAKTSGLGYGQEVAQMADIERLVHRDLNILVTQAGNAISELSSHERFCFHRHRLLLYLKNL
jgi:hypothetical protein